MRCCEQPHILDVIDNILSKNLFRVSISLRRDDSWQESYRRREPYLGGERVVLRGDVTVTGGRQGVHPLVDFSFGRCPRLVGRRERPGVRQEQV